MSLNNGVRALGGGHCETWKGETKMDFKNSGKLEFWSNVDENRCIRMLWSIASDARIVIKIWQKLKFWWPTLRFHFSHLTLATVEKVQVKTPLVSTFSIVGTTYHFQQCQVSSLVVSSLLLHTPMGVSTNVGIHSSNMLLVNVVPLFATTMPVSKRKKWWTQSDSRWPEIVNCQCSVV